MNQLPRLSGTEREVLQLLKTGTEMYGLELVKSSDKLKRGSIYVYLSRMVDKGFLIDRVEKREGQPGMPRRLYRISGLGQRILAAVDAFEETGDMLSGAAGC